MSQESSFFVEEFYRDRYSRAGEANNLLKKILLPANGIGIRTEQDLKTFVDLKFSYPTDHLGFCITNQANSENTLFYVNKKLKEEKVKFKPTIDGKQLQIFSDKTILAVEPSTQFTFWTDNDNLKKMQNSLDTPKFLKNFADKILNQKRILGGTSQAFKEWKEKNFEQEWENVVSDNDLLDDLILENRKSQIICNADMLIPPSTPVVSEHSFEMAKKIIEYTEKIWNQSTTAYLNIKPSILNDDDLRAKIIDFYENTKLPILMLKIHDFEPTNPDNFDQRNAFAEIQKAFCSIRETKKNKCTILLEGGKLTYVSLTRGFDIVTNHISGKNKFGGVGKKGQVTDKHSQYYMRDKKIMYPWSKIQKLSKNELRLTHNEHALTCRLPCCSYVTTLEGITVNYWNHSITRPHFALNMNEDAKQIYNFIYGNKIQDAKKILLSTELCVLKNLIPDV